VRVTFARHLPDNLRRLQEQSFQHHYKKSQEERWMNANYVPPHDMQAEVGLQYNRKVNKFFLEKEYN